MCVHVCMCICVCGGGGACVSVPVCLPIPMVIKCQLLTISSIHSSILKTIIMNIQKMVIGLELSEVPFYTFTLFWS